MPELPLITSEDFAVLEPEWAALWAQVPGATPFLHPAWQKTWLAHFGQDAAAVFLSIRRDESLIGVATLDIDRDEDHAGGFPGVGAVRMDTEQVPAAVVVPDLGLGRHGQPCSTRLATRAATTTGS